MASDRTTTPRNRIPLEHARSWLLTAATSTEQFTIAHHCTSDAVIYDLEDGILPGLRGGARNALRSWLSPTHRGWVRINPAGSPDWRDDLDALRNQPGVEGVVLAKCESAQHIEETATRLPASTPIIALIESALGIERGFDIASTPHTQRLAFGIGDFRLDTATSTEPAALAYARGRMVVASRAAGIAGPIDGPTVSKHDNQLEIDLGVTRSMGFTGKLCMRPEDTARVNTALSPTTDDVQWAGDTIDRLGIDGHNIRHGSDRPALARAHRIHQIATVFSNL